MATAAKEIVPAKRTGRKLDGRRRNGGAREGAGRPGWKPDIQRKEVSNGIFRDETEEEAWERCKQEVRHYTAIGYPQEIIARIMQPAISVDTLTRLFRYELDNGKYVADAKVAGTGYYLAVSGREPSMTRFWMRARLGWRDTGDIHIPNAPIQFQKIEGDDW